MDGHFERGVSGQTAKAHIDVRRHVDLAMQRARHSPLNLAVAERALDALVDNRFAEW